MRYEVELVGVWVTLRLSFHEMLLHPMIAFLKVYVRIYIYILYMCIRYIYIYLYISIWVNDNPHATSLQKDALVR